MTNSNEVKQQSPGRFSVFISPGMKTLCSHSRSDSSSSQDLRFQQPVVSCFCWLQVTLSFFSFSTQKGRNKASPLLSRPGFPLRRPLKHQKIGLYVISQGHFLQKVARHTGCGAPEVGSLFTMLDAIWVNRSLYYWQSCMACCASTLSFSCRAAVVFCCSGL